MTLERKIASAFRMDDETWKRHANPWSVWTRNTVLAATHSRVLESRLAKVVVASSDCRSSSMDVAEPASFLRAEVDGQLGGEGRAWRARVAEPRRSAGAGVP